MMSLMLDVFEAHSAGPDWEWIIYVAGGVIVFLLAVIGYFAKAWSIEMAERVAHVESDVQSVKLEQAGLRASLIAQGERFDDIKSDLRDLGRKLDQVVERLPKRA